ncbi:hypothetical protein LAZ67_8001723 [Cordylochernes scorpioides]|uniref:RNA-directed DNA polymerase n=1 Tax=Cordylochernes scorpioides TaxID=51811 RepID=A0ABY6KQH5_9ARAC|nr:hypothetical protein LAZ67_8001723 [Cordylochernes scorpioides]
MYRIKSKYFWPSMLKDVSEFVKTCHLCQSRKGSNQLPSGLLQPIPPANFPFERIGIDFVGPLPSTKNRKKWIIVLTDYYTRYAETRAVSEATVKEVSKFLVEDIFLRHGAPQYLISDRGSQFTSNLMKEVMKTCKIKHCFTTSYHPQTNGLTERLNRTLINMLSMYVNTDQKNWDEILPFITHAYNTTIQETTGYSPFFLMFGREPTSLLDDRNISVDIDKDDYDEYIKHHLDKINRTRKLVINNTIKTQERMKKNYDKKHMERSYEPGELVAVWTPIRKIGKCEKLLRKYFGPYRILKKLSNVNYLIEPKDNPGQDPLIVHVSRLKPYFERIDEVFWIVFDFYLLKKMDQRTCIKFCVENEIKCADAFRMLTVAYGEATLDRSNVYRWYKMFSEGREDVNDEERARRPSTSTTDEKINEVEKMILTNRRITVREVAEDLNISIGSCHSIFINDLGMRRVAAKFVQKLLNCDQKQHRMNIANEMLDSVRDDPNLLQRVITGDEAWVYGYDVETKAQSSQWKLPHEPRPKKARQVRSNVKVLLTVFFNCRGVVHHEFLPQGRTVNKEYYLQIMRNLREAIRQKRPDLWKNKNWLLHHDNAPAHTSLLVRDFLAKNNTLMRP